MNPLIDYGPSPQARLLRRYLFLYGLFGFIVGVRFALDAWVLELRSDWLGGKHLLMALSMLGMLLGELLGARISDGGSRVMAIVLATIAYSISACASLIAVLSGVAAPLFVGALAFGVGLGMQHASLDAWFTTSTKVALKRKPRDSEMGWGFSTYTFGFFVAQAASFPLMYGFKWDTQIASGMAVLPHSVSSAPYVLALAACALILVFRPLPVVIATDDLVNQKGGEGQGTYSAVFRRGGVAFLLMVLVGSSISFQIQHIDTFSATDLVKGETLLEKTLGLALVHFLAFAIVTAFSWTLEASEKFQTLYPQARCAVLGVNLLVSVVLLGTAMQTGGSGTFLVAVFVGLAHALLNTLPQVVKWAVLDCARIPDQARAASVLGIAKRVPNMVLSLALVAFGVSQLDNRLVYYLLIGSGLLALLALTFYFIKIRGYQAMVVCDPESEGSIRVAIERGVGLEPNTTVRISVRRSEGEARVQMNVDFYATAPKEEYVGRALSSIRNLPGVRDVRVLGSDLSSGASWLTLHVPKAPE